MTIQREQDERTLGACAVFQDHRKGPRRRGEALNSAIFDATRAELTEVGYAELTMKGIARRARASKGSLYRRWPSRAELVVDAIADGEPDLPEMPDTGSVREDIHGFLCGSATKLAGPRGEAIRGLMADTIRDEELSRVVRHRFVEPSTQHMLEMMRRGVVRGEVRPGSLTPLVAAVGPQLLHMHFMLHGAVDETLVDELVDSVVMPLIRTEGP